jgi:hypothetical protein
MRLIIGMLACVAASAVTVAMADPPAATTTAPSATAPAADAAKPSVSMDDDTLRAAGYKPQMKDGQKVWCRKEAQTTGTRLSRDKETCNNADVIKEQLKSARETTERSQKNQLNKQGN